VKKASLLEVHHPFWREAALFASTIKGQHVIWQEMDTQNIPANSDKTCCGLQAFQISSHSLALALALSTL
jgi:hypothetical protein